LIAMQRLSLATCALSLAMATSCRGSAPPASPERGAARDEWSALSWEDRHDKMTFAVLPNMARAFQRFDGAADPTMTCATCHGADAELVHYAMPHGLPALDPAHLPDRNAADPREAKIARFMFDEVTPAMADLVGVSPYDPATRRGFSCFNCHPSR
jgi:hypothetical protein